jgi:hypothetical protein
MPEEIEPGYPLQKETCSSDWKFVFENLIAHQACQPPREHWAGEFALPSRCLQRAQEVQDVLHLRRAERFEVPDYSICF